MKASVFVELVICWHQK